MVANSRVRSLWRYGADPEENRVWGGEGAPKGCNSIVHPQKLPFSPGETALGYRDQL